MDYAGLYALLSVVIVSVISLVGIITISIKESFLHRILFFLVALAVGALFGDTFIHLIPEAFSSESVIPAPLSSVFIIVGILGFFVLEKYLHLHHEHDECRHIGDETCPPGTVLPVGKLVLVSDAVHNFIDGIIIGISYLVSIPVGIATTIAVILHEIPQEIGDFSVLLLAGYARKKALLYNFLSACTSIAGVFFVFLTGNVFESLLAILIPFTAGIFIYIASVDLVPELHKRKSSRGAFFEVLGILLGVCAMYLLLFLE
jgi:zinc and cadmium transporter